MSEKSQSALKRLWGLLNLDRKDIFQTFYYAIFAGILNLSVPLGIQAIVNLIQGGRVSTSWIVLVVLVTIAVGLVGVLELMQMRIVENIQQKIFTRASFEFAYRFPKIKMEEFQNSYPPEIANRFFDIVSVQKGVSKLLLDFPAALLQIIFGLLLLSLYHPFFIIYGILLVGLILLVFKFTAWRGLETSLDESKYKYKVAHWLQEVARSLISFKAAGSNKMAMEKNDQLTHSYLNEREGHFRILRIQYTKLIVFKVLVTAGLLVVGGLLVLNQQMNIGQFVAAEIIILLILGSVEKLIRGLETIYDTLTSLEKIGQVVDRSIEEPTPDVNSINDISEMNLELQDVQYKVMDRQILNNINLTIPQGRKILVRGSHGSGKSSLLKVVAGINQYSAGNAFVNNYSMKGVNLDQYRQKVGVVLSEEFPFEGTIRENITFGDKSISDKEIFHALEIVGLADFVKRQSKGLKTILYPEGKHLSSSVGKKIVLARSIVKKPLLLILKEPFEQFEDSEIQRIIRFLTDPVHNWSILVASKNKIWDAHVDEIITLEEGSIKKSTKGNA